MARNGATLVTGSGAAAEPQRRPGRPALTAAQLAERRNAVTAAARELFVRDGYSAVSIRRVADRAGMTPKTVYSYFDAKLDLLRTLWSDVFDDVFDSLDRIDAAPGDPVGHLVAVCSAYVRYWIEHPDHYRLVFMSGGVDQSAVTGFIDHGEIASRFAVFTEPLMSLTDGGSRVLAERSELLVCAMHGIAHCHITISGYPWQSSEALVTSLVSVMSSVAQSDRTPTTNRQR